MAAVVVELTGDEAKLLASMQKVIAQNTKMGDSFKGMGGKAKESADLAVKESQRVERENKKIADAIYREHEKMLADKARESRQAALAEEALARKTAFVEVQAAIKAADQEIAAVEKIAASKRKAADKEVADAKRSREAVVNQVLGFVAGYASISTAIGAVTGSLRDQIELQKESLNIATEIAKSQAGAVKNLTGLSSVDKAKVLQESKVLQAEVGFSDQKYIVEAIGAGFSAIGDLEATKSAVRAAADLSRDAPDELATIASGALDVSRGSGVTDAKKNLGFLLQIVAVSRVEDPAALSRTVAPAISSGVNTVKGQDKQEASREIGSVFSELNRFATDTKGESTRTATITLLTKMEEFFRKIPEERELINAQVKELESKLSIDPVEQAKINRAEFDVTQKEKVAKAFEGSTGPRADDARIDLEEAKARRDQVIKDATLDDEQMIKLKKLQAKSKALDGVSDSDAIFGRIDQFQQSPGLRDTFLETPFGPEEFMGGIRQLLTSGSEVAKNVKANKSQINFDAKTYNQTVAEIETVSPELRLSKEKAREDGRKQLERDDPKKATQAIISEIANNALVETRRSGFAGSAIDYTKQGTTSLLAGSSQTVSDSAALAVAQLESQKFALKDQVGGPSKQDQVNIGKIDEAISRVQQVALRFELPLTTDARAKELNKQQIIQEPVKQEGVLNAVTEQNQLMLEQNRLLAEQNKLLENGNGKVDKQTEVIQNTGSDRTPAIRAAVANGANQ